MIIERKRNELDLLREKCDQYDPDWSVNISLQICKRNIYGLRNIKDHVWCLNREASPRCLLIFQIFKCLDFKSVREYKSLRNSCLTLQKDLDHLIEKNHNLFETLLLEKIQKPDSIEDPMELAAVFLYGSRRGNELYTGSLRQVYQGIENFAGEGKYSLRMLRAIAKASCQVFDNPDKVKVQVGSADFEFHRILLQDQCRIFLGQEREISHFDLPGADPKVFGLIHSFVEYNFKPNFDSVKEKGAVQFLSLCQTLILPKSLAWLAIEWLIENSSLLKIKENNRRLLVAYRRSPTIDNLKTLAYIDPLFSIHSLDVGRAAWFTDDMLSLIRKLCPNLRILVCSPVSQVSMEGWTSLFNQPSLKVLKLNINNILATEIKMSSLSEAIAGTENPPIIRLVNYHYLSTKVLLEIAEAFPKLDFLDLERRKISFRQVKQLFSKHPNLTLCYYNRLFKSYSAFYTCFKPR